MPEAGRLWAFKVWLRRSNLDPPTLAQMHPVILHISIIIKSKKSSTISCFWHHHYRHYDFQCKALLSFPKCLESCIFSEVHWSQSQLVSMWYVLNHCIGKHFSSPRAESARAFTGRRCPHSGRGEDFLTGQPNFFTETAVTPERKVEKSFRRWEINRHAEG